MMGEKITESKIVNSSDSKESNVNSPKHYTSGGIETIDFIAAKTKDLDGYEAYLVGNIIKYISRYDKKNGIEDLDKANWYLKNLIALKVEETNGK